MNNKAENKLTVYFRDDVLDKAKALRKKRLLSGICADAVANVNINNLHLASSNDKIAG